MWPRGLFWRESDFPWLRPSTFIISEAGCKLANQIQSWSSCVIGSGHGPPSRPFLLLLLGAQFPCSHELERRGCAAAALWESAALTSSAYLDQSGYKWTFAGLEGRPRALEPQILPLSREARVLRARERGRERCLRVSLFPFQRENSCLCFQRLSDPLMSDVI